MITDRRTRLKPILESTGGIHLSAYLTNRHDLIDLKRQIGAATDAAEGHLRDVMSAEDRRRLLEPLNALVHDARVFSGIRENIGLFRTASSFRMISIPVPVEELCVVASSFHVKPLLKWLQDDREFLIAGIDGAMAHLYFGSNQTLSRAARLPLPMGARESAMVLDNWLRSQMRDGRPPLFLVGSEASDIHRALQYTEKFGRPIDLAFTEGSVPTIAALVRARLGLLAVQEDLRTLREFKLAEQWNLIKKNIFEIGRAAVRGRVRKLMIADGLRIFGKLDARTGQLTLHPFELDHEDDDVLDDLAQTVLRHGGDVLVANRQVLPHGRPAVAIIETEPTRRSPWARPHHEERERA